MRVPALVLVSPNPGLSVGPPSEVQPPTSGELSQTNIELFPVLNLLELIANNVSWAGIQILHRRGSVRAMSI